MMPIGWGAYVLKEVAKYFRLSDNQAKKIIGHIKETVKGWGEVANKYNIRTKEQELMAAAFELVTSP